jgi:cytidine deaminase
MDVEALMAKAREAANRAYAPYSKFRVGAALALSDGTVVTGVNVENRSFGLGNCAERSAIFTAVSQGRKDMVAIAVAGPDATEPLSPCGACRQVISEFCPPEMPVYCDDANGGWVETTVGGLLPMDALQHLAEGR